MISGETSARLRAMLVATRWHTKLLCRFNILCAQSLPGKLFENFSTTMPFESKNDFAINL